MKTSDLFELLRNIAKGYNIRVIVKSHKRWKYSVDSYSFKLDKYGKIYDDYISVEANNWIGLLHELGHAFHIRTTTNKQRIRFYNSEGKKLIYYQEEIAWKIGENIYLLLFGFDLNKIKAYKRLKNVCLSSYN